MLLATAGRLEDAERIIETALRFDYENLLLRSWANQVRGARQSQGPLPQPQGVSEKLAQLEQELRTNPGNAKVAFELASAYLQMQQTNASFQILDRLTDSPQADVNILLSVAKAYGQLRQAAKLEAVLQKLVKIAPQSPEAWYDLASTEAQIGKTNEAVTALTKALELNTQRLAKQPTALDLRKSAATDQSLAALRGLREFQQLIGLP